MTLESPWPWTARGLDLLLHRGRRLYVDRHGDLSHLVALSVKKYDGWDATDESQDGPRVLLEPADRWLLAQS